MVEIKVKKLSGLLKISGLIGAKKPYPIFFKTRFGIHTFGLRFPIDVIILDKNYKVVKLVKALQPFRISLWSPKYDSVIELPSGEINHKKIHIGNIIKLNFV